MSYTMTEDAKKITPFNRPPFSEVLLTDPRIPEKLREFLGFRLVDWMDIEDIVICGYPENKRTRDLAAAAFINEVCLRYYNQINLATAWLKIDYLPNYLCEMREEGRWDEYRLHMHKLETAPLVFVQGLDDFGELSPPEKILIRRIYSSRESSELHTLTTFGFKEYTLTDITGFNLSRRVELGAGDNSYVEAF